MYCSAWDVSLEVEMRVRSHADWLLYYDTRNRTGILSLMNKAMRYEIS